MKAGIHLSRRAALLSLAGLVAGCGVKLPGGGARPQLFVLTPNAELPPDLPPVAWQLLVEQPVSPAALDTPRIAVAYSPIEIDYFARANWTDRPPDMVQRLIVEAFENSHRIVGVGRDAIGLRSDFLLKTDLRDFQAEYQGRPATTDGLPQGGGLPVAHIRINAKLVKLPQRVIVASRTFEARVTAERNDMSGIVTAYDTGLGQAIGDLVAWTLVEGETIIRKSDD